MKFIYPAVFRPTEDKKYNAFFPDLACCEASGDTLDDAIENANAAAYDWIYTELMEFEGKLPPVSEESDLDLQEGDVVRNISVNIRFQDGWDEECSHLEYILCLPSFSIYGNTENICSQLKSI